jgi:hypothetical protein
MKLLEENINIARNNSENLLQASKKIGLELNTNQTIKYAKV